MSEILESKMIEFEALSNRIKPLLAGQRPEIQGAALADLVSIYFAGHHPALREQQINIWIKAMRKLIPVNEAELFGKSENWDA